jgi:hypothetical protein
MESISVRPCSFILVRGGLGWIDLDLILDKLVMGLFHPNPLIQPSLGITKQPLSRVQLMENEKF